MPTPETLERFVARVAQNAHVEAIEEFYTANASMQENQSAPRLCRDNHATTTQQPRDWRAQGDGAGAVGHVQMRAARAGQWRPCGDPLDIPL